jgi:hypothetical protein
MRVHEGTYMYLKLTCGLNLRVKGSRKRFSILLGRWIRIFVLIEWPYGLFSQILFDKFFYKVLLMQNSSEVFKTNYSIRSLFGHSIAVKILVNLGKIWRKVVKR